MLNLAGKVMMLLSWSQGNLKPKVCQFYFLHFSTFSYTGLNAAFNKGLSNVKLPLNLSHHFKSCLSIQNLS